MKNFSINNWVYRADINEINKLRNFQVANIGDAKNRIGCIPHSRLKPINQLKLIGSAYTVKVPAGDNLLIYYAIDNAKKGDILVIDGVDYKDRALVGEILVSFAIKKGIAGIVVNGAIRDYEKLKELNIPIYFSGISPNGPYKNGPGYVNYPISINNVVINPGDIIIGDQDGLVSVRPGEIDEIVESVEKIVAKENSTLSKINNDSLDLNWLYEFLSGKDIDFFGEEYDD
ncbi:MULTISPECIES: RraA family protein [Helcococcus]|uniref:Putative 4-hydroxy-4-methyl-2-oxoglutarate aldolase n=1 Tax=Helcococcus bovis TaxID=3153252 RepID=A0ABW9F4B8_9FIRM